MLECANFMLLRPLRSLRDAKTVMAFPLRRVGSAAEFRALGAQPRQT